MRITICLIGLLACGHESAPIDDAPEDEAAGAATALARGNVTNVRNQALIANCVPRHQG